MLSEVITCFVRDVCADVELFVVNDNNAVVEARFNALKKIGVGSGDPEWKPPATGAGSVTIAQLNIVLKAFDIVSDSAAKQDHVDALVGFLRDHNKIGASKATAAIAAAAFAAAADAHDVAANAPPLPPAAAPDHAGLAAAGPPHVLSDEDCLARAEVIKADKAKKAADDAAAAAAKARVEREAAASAKLAEVQVAKAAIVSKKKEIVNYVTETAEIMQLRVDAADKLDAELEELEVKVATLDPPPPPPKPSVSINLPPVPVLPANPGKNAPKSILKTRSSFLAAAAAANAPPVVDLSADADDAAADAATLRANHATVTAPPSLPPVSLPPIAATRADLVEHFKRLSLNRDLRAATRALVRRTTAALDAVPDHQAVLGALVTQDACVFCTTAACVGNAKPGATPCNRKHFSDDFKVTCDVRMSPNNHMGVSIRDVRIMPLKKSSRAAADVWRDVDAPVHGADGFMWQRQSQGARNRWFNKAANTVYVGALEEHQSQHQPPPPPPPPASPAPASQRPNAAQSQPSAGSHEMPAYMVSWFDGVIREIDVRVQQQMDVSDKKLSALIDHLYDRVVANEPTHPGNCFCVPCMAKRNQK